MFARPIDREMSRRDNGEITNTDLKCYIRDNPFANVSGLMRISKMNFEQATKFWNENERQNPFGIAFSDALPERHGNSGSDELDDSYASELDYADASELPEICAGIPRSDGHGVSGNG